MRDRQVRRPQSERMAAPGVNVKFRWNASFRNRQVVNQ